MSMVGVIVPIYSAEDNLVDTLDSIANQTFLDMDILMVNDCSSDSSQKIMNRYAALVSRFKATHLGKKL